jgi:hypothetical protein
MAKVCKGWEIVQPGLYQVILRTMMLVWMGFCVTGWQWWKQAQPSAPSWLPLHDWVNVPTMYCLRDLFIVSFYGLETFWGWDWCGLQLALISTHRGHINSRLLCFFKMTGTQRTWKHNECFGRTKRTWLLTINFRRHLGAALDTNNAVVEALCVVLSRAQGIWARPTPPENRV